jgi:hypothetical protein
MNGVTKRPILAGGLLEHAVATRLVSRIVTKAAPPQEGTDERACVDCYGL